MKALVSRFNLWQIDALGVGVCALLALIWYGAGLQPLSQARAARQAMLDEAGEREQKASHVEDVRRLTEKSLSQIRTELQSVRVRLVQADQSTSRTRAVTALAANFRLTIDEIKPGAPVAASRFTTIPILVSGSGNASDCAHFLHELRAQFPDLGVTAFELRAEPENPDRPARFTFNFVWYAEAPARPARK
jgi:hypothetical protein